MDIINAAGAQAAGVVIALNRQERGKADKSAIQEVEEQYQIPVVSIVSLEHVIAYISHQEKYLAYLPAIKAYRDKFGI